MDRRAVEELAWGIVGRMATVAQTLTNKTLTTPTIADFTNSTHDHADASGGGLLNIPIVKVKTADETVNTSATLQNDDHLVATVVASTNYRFRLMLILDVETASDFKMALTMPAGATLTAIVYSLIADANGVSTLSNAWDGTSLAILNVSTTPGALVAEGLLSISTTAGSVQVQWAQNTSVAEDTIVKKGSYLDLVGV